MPRPVRSPRSSPSPAQVAAAKRTTAALLVGLLAALSLLGCGAGAAPEGPSIPFLAAAVTEAGPGAFTISWQAPGAGQVTVYAGTDPARVGRTRQVAVGAGSETRQVTGLPAADRWWFELVPATGQSLVLADRSLHLAGAPNFRDLGGYRTQDGRWVRMGALYRSDQLDKLTDADLAKVTRLGIRTVVDLRTAAERSAGPDRVPAGARGQVEDVLAGSGVSTDIAGQLSAAAAATDTMRAVERVMVDSPGARSAYRGLVAAVADPGDRPLVFHCTAGKDRTGWASASILTALGVPEQAVLDDYLRSNTYVLPKYAPLLAALPAAKAAQARPLLEVRPEYLRAGIDEAALRYGSMDGYLRQALGASPDQLRGELLVGRPG
jgi:protein-tyrosine phosphatase